MILMTSHHHYDLLQLTFYLNGLKYWYHVNILKNKSIINVTLLLGYWGRKISTPYANRRGKGWSLSAKPWIAVVLKSIWCVWEFIFLCGLSAFKIGSTNIFLSWFCFSCMKWQHLNLLNQLFSGRKRASIGIFLSVLL